MTGPWNTTGSAFEPPDVGENVDHAIRTRLSEILFDDVQRAALRVLRQRAGNHTLNPAQIQDAIERLCAALLRE